jgi:hypothetical protein
LSLADHATSQKVAFWISEVRVPTLEELRGNRLLRHASTGRASPLDQLVDVLWTVGGDDRAADAAASAFRHSVGVAPQVVSAEQREQRAAKLEHDELIAVEHQWPAKTAVEVAQARDV